MNMHEKADAFVPAQEAGENYRQAPCNLEAEQAILGALLVSNSAHERVSDILRPSHFFDPLHGHIYETIEKTIQAGKLATPITMKHIFEDRIIDDYTTVAQYLGKLAAMATTIINVREYARTVIELHRRRALILIGEEMVTNAYEAGAEKSASGIIEDAEQRLYAVSDADLAPEMVAYGSVVDEVLRSAQEAFRMGGRPAGFSTGFPDLDRKLGGLEPGKLYVVAGRPSMGKTALATNIAVHVARKGERTTSDGEIISDAVVGFFTLEMPKEELVQRIVATDCGINARKIKTGDLTDQEMEKLARFSHHFKATRLHIDETGGISVTQLAARARRMKRKMGLDLLVIDYLQIMTGAKSDRFENRVLEIQNITQRLKALAKELHIPIILLSQLSRALENRAEKRPQLSDLRESGAIEQDADVVIFVFREEYYIEREKPPSTDLTKTAEWEEKLEAAHGLAEAIIGKARGASVGTVELAFDAELTQFSSLAREASQ